ncbi:MAG: SRPBCC family protein [Rhodococcus sp.]|nr:SRPBCC family protein [Rhodococcus sp. (in: high G+C Gram-positive bacteria)]
MAKTLSSIVVPVSPDQAFAALTDFTRYGDWLIFHHSWRGEVPKRESLGVGSKVSSVLVVKGNTLPFDWQISVYSPPRELRFSGKEKGLQVTIKLSVAPRGGRGSEVTFQLELGGLPAVGPIGKAAVKSLHGDVEESMARFATTCAT